MNVIICDDDSCYREALRNTIHSWALLHQLRNTIIVRCFDSSEEIFNACKNGLTIDIAFLDIQIPGEMNGLELAKSIRSTNEQASIVFVTNYSEYACDGYSVNALRYLQKPICDSMVYECLDIAYRQWEFAKEQFIYVNINKQKIVLPFQLKPLLIGCVFIALGKKRLKSEVTSRILLKNCPMKCLSVAIAAIS